jgi:hypothetical protein
MNDTTSNLLAIIADIRQALGTPDDVDVREYARTVAAKAAQCRMYEADISRMSDELRTATAYREGMELLAAFVNRVVEAVPSTQEGDAYIAHLAQLAAKAQKWDAVPWDVLYGVVYGMGDDCIDDMRRWFLMHAPQEARG